MIYLLDMTEKQKYELYCARPILEHLGVTSFVLSSDSPDLFIEKDGLTIGIEVVSCFPDEDGNGSYNSLESRVYSVCRDYSNKLKHEGIRGRFGAITFTDAAYRIDRTVSTHRFKQIVFEEIERKLAQMNLGRKMRTREEREYCINQMAAGVFDCKYVESVSYHDMRGRDFVEFCPMRVGYYSTIDSKFVLACIEKKERKLPHYKEMSRNKSINEYWLFICIPSNSFCDIDGFEMPAFQTSFDKVFITDFDIVIDLKKKENESSLTCCK